MRLLLHLAGKDVCLEVGVEPPEPLDNPGLLFRIVFLFGLFVGEVDQLKLAVRSDFIVVLNQLPVALSNGPPLLPLKMQDFVFRFCFRRDENRDDGVAVEFHVRFRETANLKQRRIPVHDCDRLVADSS